MSSVKLGYGAASSGMAGELWLGWERFCAARSCMVWYGRQGGVSFGLAGFCWVVFGLLWQAIKGGKNMVYKWKDAARLKTDAQTAGEVCEKLERNGGLSGTMQRRQRLIEKNRLGILSAP